VLRAAAPALRSFRAAPDAGWFPDILDVDGEPGKFLVPGACSVTKA
jgi:hypothetical protein